MTVSRSVTTMTALAVLLLAVEAFGQCLLGTSESSAERARRQSAVDYASAVNAAQARFHRQNGAYAPLDGLTLQASPPVGFVPRLLSGPFGYALRLTDALDPCLFTLFSDEYSVVFEARPTILAPAAPDQSSAGWNRVTVWLRDLDQLRLGA